MKILPTGMLLLALTLGSGLPAQDKDNVKEITLKGTICCPKCELGIAKKCGTCIVVKDAGKDVVFLFDKESDKKYHKEICGEAKKGTVIGRLVTGKDRVITVTKVTFE